MIDADSLKKKVRNECLMPDWCHVLIDVAIANSPTIEERKKATWIEDGYRGLPCVCSYCGDEGTRGWNYCPNCGSYNGGET